MAVVQPLVQEAQGLSSSSWTRELMAVDHLSFHEHDIKKTTCTAGWVLGFMVLTILMLHATDASTRRRRVSTFDS